MTTREKFDTLAADNAKLITDNEYLRGKNAELTVWRENAALALYEGTRIVKDDWKRIDAQAERIAELEVAVEYATKAIAGTRQDADACIAGLKVRIAKLEAACERLLKRLDARERYAAGYRVGRVPESVFDALEQTRDAENEARAALAHKEA